MTTPTIQQLAGALHEVWDAETSFTPHEWSTANPARGQCLVSSLCVQSYYGGNLRRYTVTGKDIKETHYCNILDDGTIIDTTASQYPSLVVLEPTDIKLKEHSSARAKYLANPNIRIQYELLKVRVELALNRQVGVL